MKKTKIMVNIASFLVVAFLVLASFCAEKYISKDFVEKILEENLAPQEEMPKQAIPKPETDISNWKTYQSKWFGFEVKYPENWQQLAVKKATAKDKWEYRYLFRRNEENVSYVGFDVVVYNTKKIESVLASEEAPSLKVENSGSCDSLKDHLVREENYLPEEVYISSDDNCYNPTLFYAFASGGYAYNIVPVGQRDDEESDIKKDLIENFPDFFSIAESFDLINIQRSTPAPKITAPKPTAKTKVGPGGKRTCAKKGDDPSRSDTHSKKHLDMECCLDPDEIPNPNCYYNPGKYGKYLN